MKSQLGQLADRIRTELAEVELILVRVENGWQRAEQSQDSYMIDSVALNLHGFYGGLERILERIAAVIDGVKPSGERWHRTLLEQMTVEIADIRPAVLSATTLQALDEYRAFRHVVRNVYTFYLDPERVGRLAQMARRSFEQTRAEILAFVDFIERQDR